MRICFVGPANSAHIIKWCQYFVSRQHEIHVVSFYPSPIDYVKVHGLSTQDISKASIIKKTRYLLLSKRLKEVVGSIAPDIINVHYASSYGSVAALSGLKNYILSVWGSDIFDFPRRGLIHQLLLKFSLSKASYLFSTSKVMAEETSKYTNKEVVITPFGVDLELFSPVHRDRVDQTFIISLVKSLSRTYGISDLLHAYALVRKALPNAPMELHIAGVGPDEASLKQLAQSLGISNDVKWLGFISQEDASKTWANSDLAVIPSLQESFGVSAIEAQACGIPLVVSDAPGLLEVTDVGNSSIVVPRSSPEEMSKAIINLYSDEGKRRKMGIAGRKYVENNYEYFTCFSRIEQLYELIISNR